MSNSPKNFTLVINSNNYLERFTNLNDQTYAFNASVLDEGYYKVRVTYRGGNDTIANVNFDQFASIYISFNSSSQDSFSTGSTMSSRNSQLVAFTLQNQAVAGLTQYCYCGPDFNPECFIKYTPSNVIRVTLKSGTTNNLYTGTQNYLMILEFTKIE